MAAGFLGVEFLATFFLKFFDAERGVTVFCATLFAVAPLVRLCGATTGSSSYSEQESSVSAALLFWESCVSLYSESWLLLVVMIWNEKTGRIEGLAASLMESSLRVCEGDCYLGRL